MLLLQQPSFVESVRPVESHQADAGRSGIESFQALGRSVDADWRARNYDEEAFPEIAATALAAFDDTGTPAFDVLAWLRVAPELPAQEDIESRFGSPPVTLFRTDRFFVSVLYWLDGTTGIHQHGFSGAFRVLLGSSIHARYGFEQREKINTEMLAGAVRLEAIELLKRGEVRRIPPGSRFIHALFHLERPSATIVVRTYHTPGSSPQYDYLKPHLARDPFYREQAMTRRLQALALLYGMKHPDAVAMTKDLVERSDFFTAFHALQQAHHHLSTAAADLPAGLAPKAADEFPEVLAAARRRHGALVDLLPPVFAEQDRQHNIIQRRSQITAPEHRFFLALLLNVPRREAIVDLVRRRFPDEDPVEKIGGWVEELSTTRLWGGKESNVLGLDGFDEDALFVLKEMFRGGSSAAWAAALRESFSPASAETLERELPAIAASIRDSVLFRGVFEDPEPKG